MPLSFLSLHNLLKEYRISNMILYLLYVVNTIYSFD